MVKFNQNAAIRGALRRQFARSPAVRDCMNKVRREVPKYNKDGSRAKKDAVQYLCNVCNVWTKSTDVVVDHIDPVVAIDEGFVDWNEFIRRLFCGPENLQLICGTCHHQKTQSERIARLLKKYAQELDDLEYTIKNNSTINVKDMIKTLNKYIAKKKTIGLESVVERAKTLKNLIKPRSKNERH